MLLSDHPKPVVHVPVPTLACRRLRICHPAYSGNPDFLNFAAYPSGSGAEFSFPFHLAVNAAEIVANNTPGYLTREDAPEVRITSDVHAALLPAGSYLFFTLSYAKDYPYPLCGSFLAWSPPATLPPHWNFESTFSEPVSYSDLSTTARIQDQKCALTREISRLQVTHLVPHAEAAWWNYRRLSVLMQRTMDVDQLANVITLRGDLNAMGMAAGHFVFAPYANEIVTIFLTSSQPDLAHQYHMQAVALPTRIHPYTLFCRFAWNIFKVHEFSLPIFLQAPGVSEVKVPAALAKAEEATTTTTTTTKGQKVGEEAPSLKMARTGSSGIPSPLQNLPDLFPHFTKEDYDLWAAQEEEATRLGSFSDDVYPGFATIMRLKSEHLFKYRDPGGAAIGRVWDGWDLSQFTP